MNTQNKFEVDDEGVRTTADRIGKEARRMRREFNGKSRHLALDPRIIAALSQEGHLCWVNDDLKGHLDYLEGIGYRYVLNREAFGDRQDKAPEERVKIRYGTANIEGTPQDIYLMIQPWEFYEEDQLELEKAHMKLDSDVRNDGKGMEKGYGLRVDYEHK